MRRRKSGLLIASMFFVLAGQALAGPQGTIVEIELSCMVRQEAGSVSAETLAMELLSPAGEVIRKAAARAGHPVKFKGLVPGIFRACVEDEHKSSQCKSVDLYPPPGTTKARFSVELDAPDWSPQSAQLNVVGTAELAVPEGARREMESCLKERQRGRPEKAREHLENALRIHPDYPEALSNLGTLHFQSQDLSRALELFESVTRIAPQLYAGWSNLGALLLETGNVSGSLQASIRALSLRPDDPFILYQVGLCHYRLGQWGEARRHLERAIQLDPVAATYPQLCLAGVALKEQRPDEAELLLRQVTELHPYSPHPPVMQALIEQLSGRVD